MNKKLKAKWLKALRGGQYEQGTGVLCSFSGDRFCCLGVLADIQGYRWTDHGVAYGLVPVYSKSGRPVVPNADEMLPVKVAGGISKEQQEDLANMNDGSVQYRGRSHDFSKIADYIEQNL